MHKSILNLMDKHYSLIYIDYRSNLDHELDKVQDAIQSQEWYPLDEILEDWSFWEHQEDSVGCILEELERDIRENFDVSVNRAENFIEDHRDELREIIYARDDSNPIVDLISIWIC